MNVDYLREVFAGDSVRIVTRLIDCDHKRIHYFHEMHHATKAYLAATSDALDPRRHGDAPQRAVPPDDRPDSPN